MDETAIEFMYKYGSCIFAVTLNNASSVPTTQNRQISNKNSFMINFIK